MGREGRWAGVGVAGRCRGAAGTSRWFLCHRGVVPRTMGRHLRRGRRAGMDTRRVLVIGCGLIGTSVGLALRRAGVHVALADHDPRALLRALRMGAGVRFVPGGGAVDVVVVATPPSTVVPVLVEAQRRGLGAVYTDVASAKGRILDEAERAGCDLASFVPGHPLAGRELSGAGAGRADLFVGRAWVLWPHPA